MDAPLVTLAGAVTHLLAAGTDGRLGAARTEGPVAGRTGDALAWLCVEGGTGELRVGSATVDVDGRRDVFDEPGWSALVPPATELALRGSLRTTLVWRRVADPPEQGARIIEPGSVVDEERGSGATARRVRTYVADGPLIVGETLNPPGGWSSWPPHRHAREECYLYRFAPVHGFGVHAAYGPPSGDAPRIVRDGDIVRITGGWHPVVAAPGAAMYYLWALAGDEPLETELDPDFP